MVFSSCSNRKDPGNRLGGEPLSPNESKWCLHKVNEFSPCFLMMQQWLSFRCMVCLGFAIFYWEESTNNLVKFFLGCYWFISFCYILTELYMLGL